jgi:predicted RNA-binding protein YlqC (UPF0109 family)
MDSIELLREMRQNLLDFLDDLMVILPDEKDLIWFHVFVKNQVPMVDVVQYIVKNIVPLEPRVLARDDEYFKTHAVLFEKLGNFQTEVNRFKMLWDANQNPDDRETIWRWLLRFIELGKQYQAASAPQNKQ